VAERPLRVLALYPDLMNIYADRGNLTVLERRCAWRGIGFELAGAGLGDEIDPDAHDLLYIGGGQDRDQALCAQDLATVKRDALHAAAARGAVVLAVCGGYQLLGRGYRGRDGSWMAGAALFPLETVAGDTRMIGDVLLESTLDEARGRTIAGFENHAGRTLLDPGALTLGRVVAGYGNDGASGYEGCRVGRAVGTYLHGPLLPRNPWLADLLLSWAIAHATGGEPEPLAALPDELEAQAHAVSAARARARGGRPA
jgi:lipid II isoglutaminyl synthase (glutamine-hydrolysing)